MTGMLPEPIGRQGSPLFLRWLFAGRHKVVDVRLASIAPVGGLSSGLAAVEGWHLSHRLQACSHKVSGQLVVPLLRFSGLARQHPAKLPSLRGTELVHIGPRGAHHRWLVGRLGQPS